MGGAGEGAPRWGAADKRRERFIIISTSWPTWGRGSFLSLFSSLSNVCILTSLACLETARRPLSSFYDPLIRSFVFLQAHYHLSPVSTHAGEVEILTVRSHLFTVNNSCLQINGLPDCWGGSGGVSFVLF